jgi:hypothetical protein
MFPPRVHPRDLRRRPICNSIYTHTHVGGLTIVLPTGLIDSLTREGTPRGARVSDELRETRARGRVGDPHVIGCFGGVGRKKADPRPHERALRRPPRYQRVVRGDADPNQPMPGSRSNRGELANGCPREPSHFPQAPRKRRVAGVRGSVRSGDTRDRITTTTTNTYPEHPASAPS